MVLASLLWATRAMVMEMALLGALRSRMTTVLALELSSGREKSKKTETELEMETETEKEPVPSHYCCWRKSLGQGRETKKTGTMKEPVPAHCCCCCWRRKSLGSGMVQKRNLATGMETIPSSSLG